MSLRLIIGRAGSGKTHTCLEEIRQELFRSPQGEALIFLVPEQATFQMEMALASTPGLSGTMRAQVLSFRRLAWRVLQEVGGASRRHIGEIGKKMVLRDIVQSNAGQLAAFHKSARQPGFIDCLCQTVSELKKYRVSPQQMLDIIAELAKSDGELPLKQKLQDIHLIAKSFDEFLADLYTDPEDDLTTLAGQMHRWPSLAKTQFWLDGFAGFTPQEYSVLEKILAQGCRVNVALCLSPEVLQRIPAEEEMFYSLWQTADKLQKMAVSLVQPILQPLVLPYPLPRFAQAPLIAHLEKQFDAVDPLPWVGDCQAMSLVAAATRRAEVEGAARKIISLCRDEDYRWREISLVVRDMNLYGDLIGAVFSDYGIPCFIDEKRNVMHHPLVEMVRSALEVAAENWSYEPVFRYLKTDLTALSRDEIDCLENYVLSHGLRGSRWYDGKPWQYRRRFSLEEDLPPSLEEAAELLRINQLKERAADQLITFCQRMKTAGTLKEMAAAVFGLVESLGVAERLILWRREAVAAGRLDLAGENDQVWDAFLDLLDQMVDAMGERTVKLELFSQIIDAGFEGIRLGLIPPALDQVFVAALDRSRQPNVKACLVLGVNDGVLPARIQDEGLFSSQDRDRLAESRCQLSALSRQRLFDEQFLSYIALTRGSRQLYVSYALADEEGKALRPSFLIRRLQEMVPDLTETICPVEPSGESALDLEFISSLGQSRVYLGGQLRKAKAGIPVSDLWWDVSNFFCGDFSQALFYTNQERVISPNVARRIFGRQLSTSVSRLEKFRACPFAHFAQFGLKLKERQEYRLAAPDLGQFFHAALEMITANLADEGKEWSQLDNADCAILARAAAEQLVPKLQNEILLSTARFRHLTRKLAATIQTTLQILAEHARRGDFRPMNWEISFGPTGPLSSWQIDLDNGRCMEITGRIDRIDGARIGDRLIIRVIDYKSGATSWDLNDLFWGLKMQLLVYLLVSLANSAQLFGRQAEPGGMLYFGVHNPLLRADEPLNGEKAAAALLKHFKMPGLVMADLDIVQMMDREIKGFSPLIPIALKADGSFDARSPGLQPGQFRILQEHMTKMLRETAGQIMDGLVTIAPYQKGPYAACGQCSFRPVCHFDLLLEDNQYHRISKEKPDRLWVKFRQSSGEGAE